MTQPLGHVLGIAVKTARGGAMRLVPEAEAERGGGIVGGATPSRKRGITFLARDRWDAAIAEVGETLPWTVRRANVLVEGMDLAGLIGRRVRVGTVELLIHGETLPCARMDAARQGLQAALARDCRGGVYGEVTGAGRFRVGDALEALPDSPHA